MNDVKTELASYSEELPQASQRVKAADALKRIDEWNLFSAPVIVCLWKLDLASLLRYHLIHYFICTRLLKFFARVENAAQSRVHLYFRCHIIRLYLDGHSLCIPTISIYIYFLFFLFEKIGHILTLLNPLVNCRSLKPFHFHEIPFWHSLLQLCLDP